MRLGIDLGGTAIKSGLVDDAGNVECWESVPTHADQGAQAVLDSLTDVCLRQLKHGGAVDSVGIGMPGRVDSEKGVLISAANLPLADIPLARILTEKLGLPVLLENDANCALYGEIFAGGGRKGESFLLVTVGTGIGGGICIGGVYKGTDGRAGEFGHMVVSMNGRPCPCGKTGCWERYASASALCSLTQKTVDAKPLSLLARQVREAGGIVDGRTVFAAVRDGCPEADAVLEEFAGYLAVGLSNLITIFRPDRIVLAGGIFQQGEVLLSRVRGHCIEPGRISLSALRGQSGLIGASLLGVLEGREYAAAGFSRVRKLN